MIKFIRRTFEIESLKVSDELNFWHIHIFDVISVLILWPNSDPLRIKCQQSELKQEICSNTHRYTQYTDKKKELLKGSRTIDEIWNKMNDIILKLSEKKVLSNLIGNYCHYLLNNKNGYCVTANSPK